MANKLAVAGLSLLAVAVIDIDSSAYTAEATWHVNSRDKSTGIAAMAVHSKDRMILLETAATVDSTAGLVIRARVTNKDSHGLLLLDRLWTLNPESRTIADPDRIYRFFASGRLLLLLGAAPLPRDRTVMFANYPHASLIGPGQSRDIEIALAPPVKDHSFYYPELPEQDYENAAVKTVQLVVQYIRSADTVEVLPSPEDSSELIISAADAFDRIDSLAGNEIPLMFTMQRRKQRIEGPILPSD